MRIRTVFNWSLILPVFVLAACAQPPVVRVAAPPASAVLGESYLLGPGDKLKIVVFNHEDLSALCVAEAATATDQAGKQITAESQGGELSGCAVVGEAGTISFPLVGEIRAAGRTVEAVGRDYADRLADGYLVNPDVSVSIGRYRPFFIIGGVQEPGAYEYKADMTISKAIALAGGRSEFAISGAAPELLRANGVLVSSETITVDTTVFPGDTVEILWMPPISDRKHTR